MRFIFCLLLTLNAFANESDLQTEIEALKQKVQTLEEQQAAQQPSAEQSQRLMEQLKKCQKHQEEQTKALQELDAED